MPTDPSELPEWNEENLSKIIADLYKEVETDQALHNQLLSDPFGVLSSRITVPEEYRGGIFARGKNLKTMTLYVPAYGVTRQAMPEGTSEVEPPDYELTCTTITEW